MSTKEPDPDLLRAAESVRDTLAVGHQPTVDQYDALNVAVNRLTFDRATPAGLEETDQGYRNAVNAVAFPAAPDPDPDRVKSVEYILRDYFTDTDQDWRRRCAEVIVGVLAAAPDPDLRAAWDAMLEDIIGLWGTGQPDKDDVLDVLAEARPLILDRATPASDPDLRAHLKFLHDNAIQVVGDHAMGWLGDCNICAALLDRATPAGLDVERAPWLASALHQKDCIPGGYGDHAVENPDAPCRVDAAAILALLDRATPAERRICPECGHETHLCGEACVCNQPEPGSPRSAALAAAAAAPDPDLSLSSHDAAVSLRDLPPRAAPDPDLRAAVKRLPGGENVVGPDGFGFYSPVDGGEWVRRDDVLKLLDH